MRRYNEDGEWAETQDAAVAARIMEHVTAMLPASMMDGAEVLGGWSGLRPGRRGGCRWGGLSS